MYLDGFSVHVVDKAIHRLLDRNGVPCTWTRHTLNMSIAAGHNVSSKPYSCVDRSLSLSSLHSPYPDFSVEVAASHSSKIRGIHVVAVMKHGANGYFWVMEGPRGVVSVCCYAILQGGSDITIETGVLLCIVAVPSTNNYGHELRIQVYKNYKSHEIISPLVTLDLTVL